MPTNIVGREFAFLGQLIDGRSRHLQHCAASRAFRSLVSIPLSSNTLTGKKNRYYTQDLFVKHCSHFSFQPPAASPFDTFQRSSVGIQGTGLSIRKIHAADKFADEGSYYAFSQSHWRHKQPAGADHEGNPAAGQGCPFSRWRVGADARSGPLTPHLWNFLGNAVVRVMKGRP